MTRTPTTTRPATDAAGRAANPASLTTTAAATPASPQPPAQALPRADASEPAELSVVVTRGYN